MSAVDVATRDVVDETALDLACEILYRFLAAALSAPPSAAWHLILDEANQRLARDAADLLRDEFADRDVPLGAGELPPDQLDLRPLLRTLADAESMRAEFLRVFGLVTCRECPPYETEYHPNDDTFFRAQQMADVAGFYRAFGVEPSSRPRERPDYLPLQLEFEALLLLKRRSARATSEGCPTGGEQADVCQEARASFFREHLSWWLPSFALALRHQAGDGFYAAASRVLAAFLPVERTRLEIPPPELPFPAKPAELPETCDGCLGDCKS